MSDTLEVLGFIGIVLAGIALVFGVLGTAGYYINSMQCSSTASEMKMESQYGIWTGCMIRVDGNWIRITAYKVMR